MRGVNVDTATGEVRMVDHANSVRVFHPDVEVMITISPLGEGRLGDGNVPDCHIIPIDRITVAYSLVCNFYHIHYLQTYTLVFAGSCVTLRVMASPSSFPKTTHKVRIYRTTEFNYESEGQIT